jgi:hypothetical protein
MSSGFESFCCTGELCHRSAGQLSTIRRVNRLSVAKNLLPGIVRFEIQELLADFLKIVRVLAHGDVGCSNRIDDIESTFSPTGTIEDSSSCSQIARCLGIASPAAVGCHWMCNGLAVNLET